MINLRTVRSENDNYVPYHTVFNSVPFKRLRGLLSVSLVTSVSGSGIKQFAAPPTISRSIDLRKKQKGIIKINNPRIYFSKANVRIRKKKSNKR